MAANFRTHLFLGLMRKFITKTHLYCYEIISCIAFLAVLANSLNFHLICCSSCDAKSHSICMDNCSDCASNDHFFCFIPNCYNSYTTLIHHIIYFGKILSETGLSHAHRLISKLRVKCYQEAGVICSYLILIYSSCFFPGIYSSPWISDRSKSSPYMHCGLLCWRYRNVWRELVCQSYRIEP